MHKKCQRPLTKELILPPRPKATQDISNIGYDWVTCVLARALKLQSIKIDLSKQLENFINIAENYKNFLKIAENFKLNLTCAEALSAF